MKYGSKYLIKKLYFLFFEFIIIFGNNNEKESIIISKGIYKISSSLENYHFNYKNNKLILSEFHQYFKIINIKLNYYFIELWKINKILGVKDNYEIIFYNKGQNIINPNKIIWKLVKLNKNQYLIQNKYNNKFLMIDNRNHLCLSNIQEINLNVIESNFKFHLIKLFEENEMENKNIKLVEEEPIDIVIKYIDLTDKELKNNGIKYIYKDFDNEELRYSVRSILKYIPWVRKIYIIMPNNKVKYFKKQKEIKEKILYVKDKDLLGFDTENSIAFSFNLFKMEKFGLSKNFIYMDDDCFIGKPLKKSDFFYYDNKYKKVFPYLLNMIFDKINKNDVISKYNHLFKQKEIMNPHSYKGWLLSIFAVEKFFIENYNFPLIKARYTHNAISANIDDIKEIYKLVQKYKYINETLFSKERHILAISFQHFYNLFQLNIKNRKVHPIPYKYLAVESLTISKMNYELMCINTGGNHIPSKRQYQIETEIMKKRFPFITKYEINN